MRLPSKNGCERTESPAGIQPPKYSECSAKLAMLIYSGLSILDAMGEKRLGDVIDDHCIKCRRVTNHSIVSLVEGEAAKVRCRTCYHDHDYRHEQAPPTKKELKKMEADALAAAEAASSEKAAAAGADSTFEIDDLNVDDLGSESIVEPAPETAAPKLKTSRV